MNMQATLFQFLFGKIWNALQICTSPYWSVRKKNPNKIIKHVRASDVTKCEKVQRVGIFLWGTVERLPEDCKVMGWSMDTQTSFSIIFLQLVSKPDYVFIADNKTIVDANRQIKFYHRVQHLSECRGIFLRPEHHLGWQHRWTGVFLRPHTKTMKKGDGHRVEG